MTACLSPTVATIEEFDTFLSAIFPLDGPGAAVIAVKDGRTLLRKGYGLANLEWNLPVTPETVFRIGSVTKQFTAVLILMLAEQGKLSIQDPIEKFLPGYPTHGHTITIEHLLTHTSGIKSYTNLQDWPKDWGKSFTLDELIDYFKYQPMDFAPGQKWSYSNSGYILLGAIVEKASGVPFDRFLQTAICEPLGMTSTRLELPQLLIPRRASGYIKNEQGYLNAPYINMTQPLAAGGMVSTVDDLARWDASLYREELLSAESLQRAHTSYRLLDGSPSHYGYGWGIHTYQGIEFIEHSGGIHGFGCDCIRIPSRHVFVAALLNGGAPQKNPGWIASRLALLAAGLPYIEPSPIELSARELAQFVGKYEMELGRQITITYQDGSLWFTWPGAGESIRLLPSSKAEFFDADSPLGRFQFTMTDEGEVKELEGYNQYQEKQFTARKVDDG